MKINGASSETESLSPESFPGSKNLRWIVLLVALGGLLAVMIRSAWVSDDAFITFRVVDNFWKGYGLRWNVNERLCVYTNPFMMLCMMGLYSLTKEFFFTSIFFTLTISIAAVAIVLVRFVRSWLALGLVFGALLASKSFMDYTTSGLENCLNYLLIALFFGIALGEWKKSTTQFFLMVLVASIGMLNRMDTILIYAPLIFLYGWPIRSVRSFIWMIVGFLPFIGWEIFSVIYYGTLIPNTALAKLNTSLPLSFYFEQGCRYYANNFRVDPITLPTILAAVYFGVHSKEKRFVAASVGIVLYLLYIFRVGGDFMTGRFFTVPFFTSLIILCRVPFPWSKRVCTHTQVACLAAIFATMVSHPLSPIKWGADYNITICHSLQATLKGETILDERAFYYPTNGFLPAMKNPDITCRPDRYPMKLKSPDEHILIVTGLGMVGYSAGPNYHVIDQYALSDPLLARLPVMRCKPPRIGHMIRPVLPEYVESLCKNQNLLSDPQLHTLYDVLNRVHRGPIWDSHRWVDIWKLNTGQYDSLIDVGKYQRLQKDYLSPSRP